MQAGPIISLPGGCAGPTTIATSSQEHSLAVVAPGAARRPSCTAPVTPTRGQGGGSASGNGEGSGNAGGAVCGGTWTGSLGSSPAGIGRGLRSGDVSGTAAGAQPHTVCLVDAAAQKLVATLTLPSAGRVDRLSLSTCGGGLATAAPDGVVRVWDVRPGSRPRAGAPAATLLTGRGAISALLIDPGRHWVRHAVGGWVDVFAEGRGCHLCSRTWEALGEVGSGRGLRGGGRRGRRG